VDERARPIDANSPSGGQAGKLYGEAYYREQLHREHWFRDNRRKHELRWQAVLRMVKPTSMDVVLDLGSAAGEQAIRIAPLVRRVTGIDISPAAIVIARDRAAAVANVEFAEADATLLAGIAEASVDKIMAIDFVEHIEDLELAQMLDSAWRVLRSGGRLAIYTPCRTHYVERLKAHALILRQIPGHVAVRTPAQLQKLFAQRPWLIVDSFFLPSTYPLFGMLDRVLSSVPGIGGLFRFRYCVALQKPTAP